jgi:serine/threonine-protein kinase HipA
MSMNGKRDGFTIDDFEACGRVASLKGGRARRIVQEIGAVVRQWPRFAAIAAVDDPHVAAITPALRLDL